MKVEPRRIHPHTVRSRLMLETASHIVDAREWPYLQARVTLREQGSDTWAVTLFASDSPTTIDHVVTGQVQIAIINPSAVCSMAVRGTGPFVEALPLRSIAVIPSYDQIIFAVSGDTGLTCLSDIRARRFPLRLSVRGQRDHSLHLLLKEMLSAGSFSVEDLLAWGGQVRYDRGMPYEANRLGAVGRGEIDAIFDESASTWGNTALDLGMRFLSIDETVLERLEGLGLRRATLNTARFPKLAADVCTLDFSGWLVYTHVSTSDAIIVAFCNALKARRDRIPWQGEGPLPLDRMVRDTPEGPLGIPLHPAAERFWRECGYL